MLWLCINVTLATALFLSKLQCATLRIFFIGKSQFMALSDQELKEIAYLARINVKEDSLPSLKKELEDILGLFEELNAAETSEISAMSHPLDLSQPTRQDEVTEENLREELLKNAPSVQSGLFLVPKVIEGEE